MGNAFIKAAAKRELDTIASSPSNEHVFQVVSFDALERIRQSLQAKIFSIEGIVVHLMQNLFEMTLQMLQRINKNMLKNNCSQIFFVLLLFTLFC